MHTQQQHWRTAPSPTKLRYVARYARGSTALDIGSGAGFYAAALRQRGFHVTTVDALPNPGATLQARLGALPLSTPFDTVLAFDVLEHEPDEECALAELRRLTRQRLLLSVPNANDALLTPYNLTFKHHIDKTHQREYFAQELKEKIDRAGFDVLVTCPEGPVAAAFFAEFLPFPQLRQPVRLLLKLLQRSRILRNPRLMADLYLVATPRQAHP